MDLNYEDEFKLANERTHDWGLELPDVGYSSESVLSGFKGADCLRVIQEISSQHTAEEISQQCFWYMLSIKDVLQKTLDTRLYYTLGYVQFNGEPVFYTPKNELRDKMLTSVDAGSAHNLHAWLTTPNMEIIDLTFGTTYGIVNNRPDVIGRCAFQHYSAFDDNMIYHPQLIGDDYLKKIGALVEVSMFHF
jgi:hypothetical protein